MAADALMQEYDKLFNAIKKLVRKPELNFYLCLEENLKMSINKDITNLIKAKEIISENIKELDYYEDNHIKRNRIEVNDLEIEKRSEALINQHILELKKKKEEIEENLNDQLKQYICKLKKRKEEIGASFNHQLKQHNETVKSKIEKMELEKELEFNLKMTKLEEKQKKLLKELQELHEKELKDQLEKFFVQKKEINENINQCYDKVKECIDNLRSKEIANYEEKVYLNNHFINKVSKEEKLAPIELLSKGIVNMHSTSTFFLPSLKRNLYSTNDSENKKIKLDWKNYKELDKI